MTLKELIKELETVPEEDRAATADDVLKFLRRFDVYREWIVQAEEVDAQLRIVEEAQEKLRFRAWQMNLPIASIVRRPDRENQ